MKRSMIKYGLMLGAISLSMSLLAAAAVEVVAEKSTPTTKVVTSQKKKAVKKAATKKVSKTKAKTKAKKVKGTKKTVKAVVKPGEAPKEVVVVEKAAYPRLPEFEHVDGWASELTIGPDGKITVVGGNNNIYERTKVTDEDIQGEGWTQIPNITAKYWANGPQGSAWVLGMSGVAIQQPRPVEDIRKPAQPQTEKPKIIIKNAMWVDAANVFRHEVTKEVQDAVNQYGHVLSNVTVGTAADNLDFFQSSWQAKLFGSRGGLGKRLIVSYSLGDGSLVTAQAKRGEPLALQDPAVVYQKIMEAVKKATEAAAASNKKIMAGVQVVADVQAMALHGHAIVFRNNLGTWMPAFGSLVQIAVGSSGQAWGINNVKGDGGGQIFFLGDVTNDKLMGSLRWVLIDGRLVQITCGAHDAVYGVNEAGEVYQRTGITPDKRMGTGWTRLSIPEAFKWISAGLDGSIWGVGRSGALYCYEYDWARSGRTSSGYGENRVWQKIDGAPAGLEKVYAGRGGDLWLLTNEPQEKGNIYFTTYMFPLIPSGTVDNLNPVGEPAVVLVSYKKMDAPVLLKPEGKYLVATPGADPLDAKSQVKLLWKRYEDKWNGGWFVGIYDSITGNNLQACPAVAGDDPIYTVRFDNKNFSDRAHTYEHWEIVPAGADGIVMLKNEEITNKVGTSVFMTLPDGEWTKNRVWTCYEPGKAAGAGLSQALKIMTPAEAKKVLKVVKTTKKETKAKTAKKKTAKKTTAKKTTKKTTAKKTITKKAAVKKTTTKEQTTKKASAKTVYARSIADDAQ